MPRKDQPDDEIIGYWRRATLVAMDQRFCERMAQALAQVDDATRLPPAVAMPRGEDGGPPQEGPRIVAHDNSQRFPGALWQ